MSMRRALIHMSSKYSWTIFRNVKLLFKKPMRSTGGEQFSVYVYFKTNGRENDE